MTETDTPRPGTGADLSRRMDRLEQNHETLSKEVANLTSTVSLVEANQRHADELHKLRFDALDSGLTSLRADLKGFMARVEGLISGEVQTPQTRQGQELVADYQRWRTSVEERFDTGESFQTQVRTVTRVALIILGSGWLATAFLLWRTLNP